MFCCKVEFVLLSAAFLQNNCLTDARIDVYQTKPTVSVKVGARDLDIALPLVGTVATTKSKNAIH
eukprot:12522323-Alexandrium_andersonii.AAC.1